MRILLCSRHPLDLRLGASKVLIELTDELRRQGHECTLVSDEGVSPGIARLIGRRKWDAYAVALRGFLKREAAAYDAVDYDHLSLPFPREEFPRETRFVARSVLLVQHFDRIRLPRPRSAHALLAGVVKAVPRRLEQRHRVACADRTCREADLVNVANHGDFAELVRRGHDPAKIVVVPFGLTRAAHEQLQAAGAGDSRPPRVAFVGTLDARKGAVELPAIMREVVEAVPGARFRIMGARYRSEEEILAALPAALHPFVELVPQYEPPALPALLAECSVGIFPSYVEGFGFGVLEMLAAGIPVVAYRSPGPPEMLSDDLLVPRGDAKALARRTIELLSDEQLLAENRAWARVRAADFPWSRAAKQTADAYGGTVAARR